jgi:trimeric autotransporter adhesin
MRNGLALGFCLLMSAAATAQEPQVGIAASVVPDATSTPPRGQIRQLAVGQNVVYSERIATGPIGRTQMLFLDGSALTVGPNSDVVLDEFVYDPQTEAGKLAISATKGVLRLVGGKISKTEPITLKTPTATIGIRGGIAIYDNGQTTFLFGKGMTIEAVQPDGSVSRVELIRPGTVNIGAGGQIGPVTPVSQQAVANSLGALEGSRGNSGGASERPTENRVAATQVAALGSTNLPTAIAPVSDVAAQPLAETAATAETVGRDVDLRDLRTGAGDGGGASTGTSSSQPRTFTGVGIGSPVFSSFNFSDSSAPHTAGFDRGLFGFAAGNMFFGFSPTSDRFAVLPFGTGVFQVDPASAFGTGGRFSGVGFANDAQTFFFYKLRLIDDSNRPLFLFGGVRNENPVVMRSQIEFRAWQLIPGFPGDNQIPLLPAAFGGNFGGAVVSPLLAALRPNTPETSVPDAISPTLFAALAVQGQGPQQRSAMVVRTGPFSVDQNPNNPTFNQLRLGGSALGSVRDSALGRPVRVQDGATTIFDQNGFSFYGAENEQPSFVLGSDLFSASAGFPYQDSAAFAQPFTNLTQSNEYYAAHAALPAPNLLPANIGALRSTRTLNGYAAGIAEARITATTFQDYAFATVSNSPLNLSISTDAARNRLAAAFRVRDVSFSFQEFNLVFGDLSASNGSRSAFIDDRRFGARASADDPSQVAGVNAQLANMAMVSFDVVPNTSFFPAGTAPCSCQFVQWGFFLWDVQGQTGPRTRGHINPWVAGELPAIGTLPTTGTASYTGHAVGNVLDAAGNRYIAAGSYTQSWNFQFQSGAATISNFDGRTLNAISLTSANGRDFGGGLGGGGASGSLHGSFVRGGNSQAAEVMGQFNFSEPSGYRAAGIVAGTKQ